MNTHISRSSDRFHYQLVFKFCIVIYCIILGGCPCIISCVVIYIYIHIYIVICDWPVQCYMCDWMDEQINQTKPRLLYHILPNAMAIYCQIMWLDDTFSEIERCWGIPWKNWVSIVGFPIKIQIELSPTPQNITACCLSLLWRCEEINLRDIPTGP